GRRDRRHLVRGPGLPATQGRGLPPRAPGAGQRLVHRRRVRTARRRSGSPRLPGHRGLRRQGRGRRGQRHRLRVAAARLEAPPRPAGIRPLVRARGGGRRGPPARLHRHEDAPVIAQLISNPGGLLAASSNGAAFPLLPALVLVPVAGAVVIGLIPSRRTDLFKLVAVLTSVATGALSLYLLAEFDRSEPGFQFVVDREWIGDLGISMHLGVDGISLFLIVMTGIIFPIAVLCARVDHDPKPYYGWLMVLMAGSMGVFMALDLVVFFAMFEVVLVPMYFLIGMWGHGDRVYSALKFFL